MMEVGVGMKDRLTGLGRDVRCLNDILMVSESQRDLQLLL
jgi:hypothetical protein